MISKIAKALLIVLLLTGCSTIVTQKNQMTLMDNVGVTLESPYISGGMLKVTNGKDGDEKRYGFINTDGEVIIPLEYKGFFPLSEELVFAIDEKGRRSYIDKTGAEVITKIDGKAIYFGDIFVDGYAVVSLEDEKGRYVIDKSGKVYLSPTDKGYNYKNLGGGFFERYYNNFANNSEGVVDINGQIKYSGDVMLITPANEFNGFFYTVGSDEYGIFDNKNFTTLTDPVFKMITKFVDSAAIVVGNDGTVKIINPSGGLVANLSKEYPNIDVKKLNEFRDGVTALNFTDGEGSIIIDKQGKTVGKTNCDEVQLFHEGLAVCKKDGTYGYVNSEGIEVLEPTHDNVTNIDNGIGIVINEGKWYRFTY